MHHEWKDGVRNRVFNRVFDTLRQQFYVAMYRVPHIPGDHPWAQVFPATLKP